MDQLKVIEKKGLRVLTTSQIADVFGTDYKVISKNFTRNKDRYTEELHFIILQGDELREFKTNRQIDDQSKHSHTLYLWTEKGAFLHAKSLNTDQAWDAYSKLVDDYFKKVEEAKQPQTDLSALSPQLQFMIQMEQKHNALEAKFNMYESNQLKMEERFTGMDEVKGSVDKIVEIMTSVPDHTKVVSNINEFARWSRLGHNEVYNKVYEHLKKVHGIDVRQRVENERERIQADYNKKTGKFYSESTLKSKVNGIDIMVRIGCLDKFNSILVGLLSQEKIRSNLRVVK